MVAGRPRPSPLISRLQYHTQRKADNMHDELGKIAAAPAEMGIFWNRVAELRKDMLESEMRDPKTGEDIKRERIWWTSCAGYGGAEAA